jgi:transcription-repair coupling factor (superfamily II helicase)
MIDRFGLLPEQTKNLVRVTQIKLKAQIIGITIVKMVQAAPHAYKLEGANKLKFTLPMETTEQRLSQVTGLLETLMP